MGTGDYKEAEEYVTDMVFVPRVEGMVSGCGGCGLRLGRFFRSVWRRISTRNVQVKHAGSQPPDSNDLC